MWDCLETLFTYLNKHSASPSLLSSAVFFPVSYTHLSSATDQTSITFHHFLFSFLSSSLFKKANKYPELQDSLYLLGLLVSIFLISQRSSTNSSQHLRSSKMSGQGDSGAQRARDSFASILSYYEKHVPADETPEFVKRASSGELLWAWGKAMFHLRTRERMLHID